MSASADTKNTHSVAEFVIFDRRRSLKNCNRIEYFKASFDKRAGNNDELFKSIERLMCVTKKWS